MEDTIIREIANELKGLNNQAVKLISQGNLEEAEVLCKKALDTAKTISYYDGMAVFFYNLANLETLRGNILKAMTYGALSGEMHERAETTSESTDKLMASLAKAAMKKGMEHEKKGELHEALEYYYASIPFSDEKFRVAILKEIELIERAV